MKDNYLFNIMNINLLKNLFSLWFRYKVAYSVGTTRHILEELKNISYCVFLWIIIKTTVYSHFFHFKCLIFVVQIIILYLQSIVMIAFKNIFCNSFLINPNTISKFL